jgi:hypothetical protein
MTLDEFLDWEGRQPARYEFDGVRPILHRLGDSDDQERLARLTANGTRDAVTRMPVTRLEFEGVIAALLQLYGLAGDAEEVEAQREFDQIALGLLDTAPRPDSIQITDAAVVWRFERADDTVLLATLRPAALATAEGGTAL